MKVERSPNDYSPLGVELEFEKLLVNIFGSEFIEAFRHKRPAGWVDLMIAFESRKRAATPFKNNALNVSLPFSFIDYYKKKKVSQKEATPVIMTPFCIIMNSKMCSFSMIYLKQFYVNLTMCRIFCLDNVTCLSYTSSEHNTLYYRLS